MDVKRVGFTEGTAIKIAKTNSRKRKVLAKEENDYNKWCFYHPEISPFMIAPYLPSLFVPIVGIFLPGFAMAALFIAIEKETVE
jgi:photosystem I reaction center subunit VIII